MLKVPFPCEPQNGGDQIAQHLDHAEDVVFLIHIAKVEIDKAMGNRQRAVAEDLRFAIFDFRLKIFTSSDIRPLDFRPLASMTIIR
jgi:hypothetical protein